MPKVPEFPDKTTGEVVPLTFDFRRVLDTDLSETIADAAWTVSVIRGTDASPTSMVLGDDTITGTKVSQKITGGVAEVLYLVTCSVDTSLSNTYHGRGLLQVTNKIY